MAAAAAQKGLNPKAPEFFPSFAVPTSHSYIPPHCIAPLNPSLYYSAPSPFLHGFSSNNPLLSAPLYNPCYPTQASMLIPQQQNLLPAPALEPTPARDPHLPVALPEQKEVEQRAEVELKVVSERVNSHRSGVMRRLRNQRAWRRGGGRRDQEGFGGFEEKAKQAWRAKVDNGESQLFWKGDRKRMMKKNAEDVEPVEPDGQKTTAMIRNIPNKYTREMLVQFLDEHCMLENQKQQAEYSNSENTTVSAFDFVYLPMDFGTGCNKGYAFVNFTNPKAVWKFHLACHNRAWEHFHSTKIREVACAKIQGKEALIKHFQNSTFACGSDEFLPACFSPPRDGSSGSVRQSTVGRRTARPHWEVNNVRHQI